MFVDHSTDYLCWDNVQAVTITLQRQNPVVINIAVAMNDDLDRKTMELLGIGLDQQAVRWHIPDALFNPSQDPDLLMKREDTIEDAGGQVYTIIDADYSAEMRHWELACTPQRGTQ